MKTTIIILTLLLTSCASMKFKEIEHNAPTTEIDKIYSKTHEHVFCMKQDGSLYNVKSFGLICSSSFVPICESNDILVHTHPIFGSDYLTELDCMEYIKQHKKYGIELFGLYWNGKLRIYQIY